MKFDISYKIDPETKEAIFKVSGDEKFAESVDSFLKVAQDAIRNILPELIRKRQENGKSKMGIPFDSLPYTIEMDENLADKIIKANPHLKGKIARAYTSDGNNVIGITIIK